MLKKVAALKPRLHDQAVSFLVETDLLKVMESIKSWVQIRAFVQSLYVTRVRVKFYLLPKSVDLSCASERIKCLSVY